MCIYQVGAHYFEEGNVQLDTNIDCKDSTILQVSSYNTYFFYPGVL